MSRLSSSREEIVPVKQMAKIVHFGKYYFPDPGGIERVTLSLAKGAAKAGHHVSVVCFQKTIANVEDVLDGVHVIRAPIATMFASQPLGFGYFVRCLSASRAADIVHVHTPNMLGALCALFIPRKTKLLVHWHSDVINKGLLGKLLRPLEFALLYRANGVVATSQRYADASEAVSPFKHKITVVPIGVPDVQDQGSDCRLPAELKEQIGCKKIILAVGRLVPYKGFHLLIQAAKRLPKDSLVVIVGDGPLRAELQRAIDLNGVRDRVLLAGRLDDASLHTLFGCSALFCLPSTNRAEAFGVVLVEAMAYGLPIVASEIPGSGVPWVTQHGLSGLNFPVGEVAALAEACNQILASDELRASLSRGARKRFIAEFTEDSSIKHILLVYDSLMSNPLSKSPAEIKGRSSCRYNDDI